MISSGFWQPDAQRRSNPENQIQPGNRLPRLALLAAGALESPTCSQQRFRKTGFTKRTPFRDIAAQTASGGFTGRAGFAGGDVLQGAADHSGPEFPQRPGIKGGPAHHYRPVERRKYTERMPGWLGQ